MLHLRVHCTKLMSDGMPIRRGQYVNRACIIQIILPEAFLRFILLCHELRDFLTHFIMRLLDMIKEHDPEAIAQLVDVGRR